MSPVTLRFLGCGDAFASGGRFQTSFLLEGGEEPVLIDCGATTLVALKRLGIDPNPIGVIVLSHLHGDHFGGMPWIVIDGQLHGRSKPLVIAGPERTEERVTEALDVLYPGSREGGWAFELRIVELPEREARQLDSATVTTFPVIHAPESFPHALRLEYGGKVIAFSGDTEWTDALLEVADGADLFVCECQTFDREVPGHLNYRTLLDKRDRLRCGRLVINHLSEEMIARVGELDVEAAEDGLVIEV
jgi:ribonuclease BN (tRNA processing enzyme)